MLPESGDQGWFSLSPEKRPASRAGQVLKIFGAEVGQSMLFPVSPQVLNGIQFRRIGGQPGQVDAAFLRLHMGLNLSAAVSRQAIPDNQQAIRQMGLQMAKKVDHLRPADGTGIESKIEVSVGDTRDGGQIFPIEVMLENRRLPSWRPSPAYVRTLGQSALVDEDDDSAFFSGFFFSAGQVLRFQWTMAASSRSMARLVGR